MANVPWYYNQYTAKERSYVDYMGNLNNATINQIENSTNKQIVANALFTKEIQSTLINNQIATETALYNQTQQLDGTLIAGSSSVSVQLQSGLSGVSRELGIMGSAMSMGFASLNDTVQESSRIICKKLDDINETLKNPLYTEARELYNRALRNYNKGLYEEVLEDLQEAIKKNKTDPFSHCLLGQTYLFGISEFSNVINLEKAVESLRNAIKYITHDAKNYSGVKPMAAEICYYLGLTYQTKANDDFHNSNTFDYQKNIDEAKDAYKKSWDYSQKMLESMYNLARCKVISSDTDGAIQDLINIIIIDHGYCIKSLIESEFENVFKDKLFEKKKKKIYPKTKITFDRIKAIMNDFQSPYSSNLTKLINTYLLNTFNIDIPPFDMLKTSIFFPEILSILEKEQSDYIKNSREREQKYFVAQQDQQKWDQFTSTLKIGQIISFGSLKWIILDRQIDKILIITEEIIMGRAYNDSFTYVSWESCTLRKYLNNDFLIRANIKERQERIVDTIIDNCTNKLFLLSVKEVDRYFLNKQDRIVKRDGYGNHPGCIWWLRDTSYNKYGGGNNAEAVFSNGEISGICVNHYNGVRPALWLNLQMINFEPSEEQRREHRAINEIKAREEQERLKQFKLEIERQKLAEQAKLWEYNGLCKYCGGEMSGIFTKKCKSCGKEK
jgi:tetratricopeptide (TPR) repeat protein